MKQVGSPRVLIVADDLTSATDGAGPFVAGGLRAEVQLSGTPYAGSADVVSVDTNTRIRSATEAAGIVAKAFRGELPGVVVKTIDSTLRGNIAEEIEAARRSTGRPLTIVAPAFPAEGRTTVRGMQLLRGVPVSRTSFGEDRSSPTGESDVRAILPQATLMSFRDPNLDVDAVIGIAIADATSDADLDELVARVRRPERVLWVGSPGLCAALARSMRRDEITQSVPPSRSLLIVVGSEHAASKEQLERVRSHSVHLDLAICEPAAAAQQIEIALARGQLVTLTDTSNDRTASQVRARLAAAVAPLRASDVLDAVVATGGDTARAVLEALEISGMRVLAEPAPGVVATRADRDRQRTFVIKAGGFGTPDLLVELAHLIHTSAKEL
ncbi:four-carbon acid sugar kinase family protein [Microbacterium sp. NPDC091662]|uniref:four-carbon acid sugar kinase family protein n=1 Tax=Microbacterium sp. NPDC091662 TaxID=3364211 RepID=UPI00382FF808